MKKIILSGIMAIALIASTSVMAQDVKTANQAKKAPKTEVKEAKQAAKTEVKEAKGNVKAAKAELKK